MFMSEARNEVEVGDTFGQESGLTLAVIQSEGGLFSAESVAQH